MITNDILRTAFWLSSKWDNSPLPRPMENSFPSQFTTHLPHMFSRAVQSVSSFGDSMLHLNGSSLPWKHTVRLQLPQAMPQHVCITEGSQVPSIQPRCLTNASESICSLSSWLRFSFVFAFASRHHCWMSIHNSVTVVNEENHSKKKGTVTKKQKEKTCCHDRVSVGSRSVKRS